MSGWLRTAKGEETFHVGDLVRTIDKKDGEVEYVKGSRITVMFENEHRVFYRPNQLTKRKPGSKVVWQ